MPTTSFGKEIRKLRVDYDQTQKDLAKLLGVSPAFLSAVEVGKKQVTLKTGLRRSLGSTNYRKGKLNACRQRLTIPVLPSRLICGVLAALSDKWQSSSPGNFRA